MIYVVTEMELYCRRWCHLMEGIQAETVKNGFGLSVRKRNVG